MKSPLLRTPDSAPDSDVSMSPAMVPRVSFFARIPRPHATTLHHQLVDVNNVLSPQLEAMSISPRLPIAQPSVATCHREILSPLVRMHSLTPQQVLVLQPNVRQNIHPNMQQNQIGNMYRVARELVMRCSDGRSCWRQ